jgi:hypothetical protein
VKGVRSIQGKGKGIASYKNLNQEFSLVKLCHGKKTDLPAIEV